MLLPHERDPVPFVQEAVWALGPARANEENLAPHSLGNANTNTNNEIKKSKPEFWLLIKPMTLCKLLLDLNKSIKITRLHTELIWPVLSYGSVTWTQTQMKENTGYTFFYLPIDAKVHCVKSILKFTLK
jgi:hypothetical protein